MKNSFVMYTAYKRHFDLLSDPDKVILLNAIFDYAMGIETELEGAVAMAFSFIKDQMDRDNEKYASICEKRREAGAKGGAPKGNRNAVKYKVSEDSSKTSKNNQNKQMLTKQAKQPDNDNDNDNDNDINNNIVKIDYQNIVNLYNTICVSFPKVTKLSESRKRAIKARLKSYSVEDLKTAFQMAEESDFLSGRNGKWNASFDWLMNETNLVKVLDGNFKNKTNGKIEVDSNLRQFIANNQVVDFGM